MIYIDSSFSETAVNLVSTFLGLAVGAPVTLRYWIATQAVVEKPYPSGSEKKFWTRPAVIGIYAVLSFVFLIAAAYYTVGYDGTPINVLLGALVFISVLIGHLDMFTHELDLFKFSVHRDSNGAPYCYSPAQEQPNRREKLIWFIIILISMPLILGALGFFDISLLHLVPSMAFLYACLTDALAPKMSFMVPIRILCGYMIATLTMSLPVALLRPKTITHSSEMGPLDETEIFNLLWQHWFIWIVPTLLAILPGIFISLCLRFDYQNFIDANPHIHKQVTASLQKIPAYPIPAGLKVGNGISFPTRSEIPPFPKPYFLVSLVSWFIASIAFAVLRFTVKMDFLPFEFLYSFIALDFAAPFMLLSVFIMATMRGEREALMNYTEAWRMEGESSRYQLESGFPTSHYVPLKDVDDL